MSELTDFLLARIKEDETKARYWGPQELASDEPLWHSEIEGGGPVLIVDSARVLAECEAKRRIVERYAEAEAALPTGEEGMVTPWAHERVTELEPVLRLLALPFADHPDYVEKHGGTVGRGE